MKVDSLLQREGRGPVERTGPIPLPGRRPRHLAGATRAARPAHPDAVTEPFSVAAPGRPGAAFAVPSGAFPVPVVAAPADGTDPAAVPRTRDPRPTPATGTAVPALAREREPRPAPPRRPDRRPVTVRRVPGPRDVSGPGPAAATPGARPGRRRPRLGRRSRRVTVLVVLAVIAVLAAAGVAVAAWLSSGSGATGLTGGSALAPTTAVVAGSAVTTGLLTPGATGTAVITVTNPNPYPVVVSTVAPAGAATASGGAGTCATTGVTFTAQNPAAVTLDPAGGTTLTLPGAVAMSTASETGCQGATFSVPVTVTVVSAA